MMDYLKRIYGLKADIVEVVVPEGSILMGETLGDLMDAHHIYVIGTYHNAKRWVGPTLDTKITPPCRLAILGRKKVIQEMCEDYGLEVKPRLDVFAEEFVPTKAGVAEVVIPPNSSVIGKTAREMQFRKVYGMALLAIYRSEET